VSEAGAARDWLSKLNKEELVWVANYLHDRAPSETFRGASFDLRALPALLIQRLEETVEGLKLITKARNNLRQKRYRASTNGRASCSFTLPRATKAKLKSLAKAGRTTETAIIEGLIEGAQQASQAQKEEKRRHALEKKISRNSSKLQQELFTIKLTATRKHLMDSLKQLARWEVFFDQPGPELSPEQEAKAGEIAKKRMQAMQEAIEAAAAKHELMSPRNFHDLPRSTKTQSEGQGVGQKDHHL